MAHHRMQLEMERVAFLSNSLIEAPTRSISMPAGVLCSSYRAEFQALTSATEHLITTNDPGNSVVLLTDSLSVL
jgi:hypothetical protein